MQWIELYAEAYKDCFGFVFLDNLMLKYSLQEFEYRISTIFQN